MATESEERAARAFSTSVRDPRLGALAVLKDRAEHNLVDYVRLMWPVTDPAQPLRVGHSTGAICEHLEAVHRGQIRNLLINCPPGFTKSSLVNVFFPSWEWGPMKRPDLRFISWAYGEHLTVRDNEKCAKVIDSPRFQALWGPRRVDGVVASGFDWDPRQNTKDYYKNSAEGFRIATGVRGMGTGERGDRLIIDDPHSVMGARSPADMKFTRDWFTSSLTSRVRNANPYEETVDGVLVRPSSCIVIMQRLEHDDIAGLILAEELDFEHLLIEMEYKGAKHPCRARESKKRPGELAWRPSSIGYVDWREESCRVIDEAIDRFDRGIVQFSPGVDTVRGDDVTDADMWWSDFCRLWLDVARSTAELADPVRYSRAAVEEQREKLLLNEGSNAVASQFDQWPSGDSGDMFKVEDWRYCEMSDVPKSCVMWDVRGWDLAASEDMTSDGTGAVLIRRGNNGNFYVLDAERVRKGPGGVRDFRTQKRAADGPSVIQDFPRDPGQAGVDQVESIAAEDPTTITRSSPESGSKAVRATPFSSLQQHHRVFLVRASWNKEYVAEHKAFPHQKMSALVDASSRAFNRLARMRNQAVPGETEVISTQVSRREQIEQLNAALRAPPQLVAAKRHLAPEYDAGADDGEDDGSDVGAW